MAPEGVIVQFGGQTPLNLSQELENAGVPIIGTSPADIERAGDRGMFKEVIEELSLLQPDNGIAQFLRRCDYHRQPHRLPGGGAPQLSCLGGRAMEIVYTRRDLEHYMKHAVEASPDAPVLVDKFLENGGN